MASKSKHLMDVACSSGRWDRIESWLKPRDCLQEKIRMMFAHTVLNGLGICDYV